MKTLIKHFSLIIMAIACSITSHAGGYDNASWYVSIDVDQARQKLIPHLSERSKANNDFEFTQLIPQGVSHITMYGESNESSTLTQVLSGDLHGFSVLNFINELEKQAGEDAKVSLVERTKHNGQTIEHFVIGAEQKEKAFYTTLINDQTLVASFSKDEVINWANNNYKSLGLHQTGLVTVHVKIESAMMHMGADIDQGSKPFQSHMFKKIDQVSASLLEDQDDLLFEIALVTADDATAKQVNAVINGLVAMNALSDATTENKALSALLNNLNIDSKGNHVMILSHLPMALLAEIDFD